MRSLKTTQGRLLAGASIAALSCMMLPASAAFAQDAAAAAPAPAAPQQVQEVVVTGSRIARKDYQSNSPLVTLSSQNLTQQADLNIQNTLNKLPQFAPDQNLLGGQTSDVQPTPTHSVGIATASLRGLGSNRNLVLIDGRRGAPVNGSLVVDLSTIPTAMIDHVETITGGASAVYGADAVAGVVNFVMKKNFHGVDMDIQYGRNQTGDGNQLSASAVFGTNFADDKGNLTFAIERMQQDATKQNTHDFFRKGWNDPTTATNALFGFGGGWTTGVPNAPSVAAMSAVFGGPTSQWYQPIFPGTAQLATIYATDKGAYTAFSGNNSGGNKAYPYALNGSSVTPGYYVDSTTHQPVLGVKNDFVNGFIQSPLDRWSFFTNGHYDFNDNVSAFFQANFARSHTTTVLAAPISAITGWNLTIPYDSATGGAASGHPVPTQLATLLNSRAQPNAPWELNWTPNPNGPIPPRSTDNTNSVFQITAGLNGKVASGHDFTSDWTWEVYGSHSESQEYTVAGGDWSLLRYQTMVQAPNWGKGTFQGNQLQPNGQPSTSPLFGSAKVTCTSGFYNAIFNGGSLSNDCLNAITAPLQSMDITKQDVVEFNTQGTLYKLPAGDLKFSVGADYRRDSLTYNPDILQSNQSFTDQVIGVYPTAYVNASTDVKEGFGELSIPILANLPGIKSFTFNPGVRYSAYDVSPANWTYKLLGDWEINDWIRARGGFNLAVRAPNVGELYLGPTEVFGAGSAYADACSLTSNAPYGAGGAAATGGKTAAVSNKGGLAGATNTYNICRALMGAKFNADGTVTDSTGSATYYNSPQSSTASPFAWNYQQGSLNVQPETARTVTAGLVLTSPFRDSPYFGRARMTVDYYKIRIDDAIEFESIDYLQTNCFNQPAATPAQIAAALASTACQQVQRSPVNGGSSLNYTPSANLATIDTAGIDIGADWAIHLGDVWKPVPGEFAINVTASILDHYDTKADPLSAWVRWKGTFGPNLPGLDSGAYDWKLNTSFAYTVGPAMVNLNWRHLPSIKATASVFPNNVAQPTNAYDVFDLNAVYNMGHGLQLRGGIQNLADTAPAITGRTLANINSVGQLTAIASSGQGTTNAGYYDTLGRRFYVGLKARF